MCDYYVFHIKSVFVSCQCGSILDSCFDVMRNSITHVHQSTDKFIYKNQNACVQVIFISSYHITGF